MALMLVRYPDGSWEYHVPFRRVAVGDVINRTGKDWIVSNVDDPADERTIVYVDRPATGGDWPGPVNDVELYAPIA